MVTGKYVNKIWLQVSMSMLRDTKSLRFPYLATSGYA